MCVKSESELILGQHFEFYSSGGFDLGVEDQSHCLAAFSFFRTSITLSAWTLESLNWDQWDAASKIF